ncbi:MAG: 2-C-methyl-D-erythritol 2,4-cyclodiphosphate synthase [Neisseriaceae bacterium]
MYRIGQGYDVHCLVPERPLIIGGVKLPFDKGLKGHSDGDVLLHAIVDALLGAMALGDIGSFYSDADPQFKGMDSGIMLRDSYGRVQSKGWEIVNLDTTVIAERPRLQNYIVTMRHRIAQLLSVPVEKVSIKAKTNEKLGYLGRQKAIEAQAIVLLGPCASQNIHKNS